jgi:RNA polymerase sigma-70 factor (ECF subfamily)
MNSSPSSIPVSLVAEAREEHEARLRRYAHRILHDEARARDVVQDTFLTLARQPAEPDLRPRLAAWLFTVCRRKALNQIRAESRHVPLESVEPMPSAEASPADQAQLSEERHQLLGLVERLPATQREVVRLRYQEGFSYQEIGAITEHSVSHVGVLLHAALQSLRREWRAGAVT